MSHRLEEASNVQTLNQVGQKEILVFLLCGPKKDDAVSKEASLE